MGLMKLKASFLLLFSGIMGVSAITGTSLLYAQNQQQAEDLLPDINPQEIEIRGEFRPSFPGLRRQPILGFDPKPRVYQIDPNREPFMESGEDIMADLPVSELDRPEPPSIKLMKFPKDHRAYVRGSLGHNVSPRMEFYGYAPLNSSSLVLGSLDHWSTGGHLNNQPSSFRFFNGRLGYRNRLSNERQFSLDVTGLSDFNHVFSADPSGTRLIDQTPRKVYQGVEVNSSFTTRTTSFDGWQWDLNYHYYGIDFQADTLSDEALEHVFSSRLKWQKAGPRQHEVYGAYLDLEMGAYEPNLQQSDNWYTVGGNFYYNRLFNGTTRINAEAGIYYVDNTLYKGRFYIAPMLEVVHNVNEQFRVRFDASGEVNHRSMKEHHEENRFLKLNNILAHSYELSGTLQWEWLIQQGLTARAGVTYLRGSHYNYYNRRTEPVSQVLTWYQNWFDDATIWQPYLAASYDFIPDQFWADLKFYYNGHSLEAFEKIPYKEQYGAEIYSAYRFSESLLLSGWLNMLGPRFNPVGGADDLNATVILGAKAEVFINPKFTAFMEGHNLLNQNYKIWSGYEERPIERYIGLSYRF